ncbi:MAG: glycosyltransferase, partial [Anaerolineales bacterium]
DHGMAAGKPLIWRLPDMWAITGHCAFSYSCERWMSGCHHCPWLNGHGRTFVEPRPTRWDFTRRVWHAKRRIYERTPLHIVVNSAWMKACVQHSILKEAISVSTISNGVDLNVFKQVPKNKARRRLGLPQEAPIVLSAAAGLGHHRKGYRYAAQAMAQLQSSGDRTPLLITMGKPQGVDRAYPLRKAQHFGFIEHEATQALLYAAADVLLCATLAEGQPQVALEALACGTPIVAFDLGPMPEFVRPRETGYLGRPKDAVDLARGVRLLLEDRAKLDRMGRQCRALAEQEFSPDLQAEQYIDLFQRILENRPEGQRLRNSYAHSLPKQTTYSL